MSLDQTFLDKIKLARSGNNKFIYRQKPTPEEDAAYKDLEGLDIVGMLLNEVEELNADARRVSHSNLRLWIILALNLLADAVYFGGLWLKN